MIYSKNGILLWRGAIFNCPVFLHLCAASKEAGNHLSFTAAFVILIAI